MASEVSEGLERIEPWEFLDGCRQREVGGTLYLSPEFTPQMVSMVAAYAASRGRPCPYINTYGGEDRVLPPYVIETIRVMRGEGWIEEAKVFGMTEKAYGRLRGELAGVEGLTGLPVTLEKGIGGYLFDEVYEWATSFIDGFWGEVKGVVLAYEEPLSTYLSAVTQSPILPLRRGDEHLPPDYSRVLEKGVDTVYFLVHGREFEENWRTHWVLSEVRALNPAVIVVTGDMIKLSEGVCEIARRSSGGDSPLGEVIFLSGMNEISLITPLAVSVGGVIVRCGYDGFDERVGGLLRRLKSRRCVISEAPERILGEELNSWFFISSRTRREVERILGEGWVYRLWLNKAKGEVEGLMRKYASMDTSSHVLYWGLERRIMEALFKTRGEGVG